jgi:hypothetical protein
MTERNISNPKKLNKNFSKPRKPSLTKDQIDKLSKE